MEPRGVPRGCELLSPLRAAPSKRSWPIASGSPGCRTCLGYTPGDLARLRSLSGRCIRDSASVVCAASPVLGSQPEARRSPPPPHSRGLMRSPYNQGNQPIGCTTQQRAPGSPGCEPYSSDGSLPNRRADRTNCDDQAMRSSSG